MGLKDLLLGRRPSPPQVEEHPQDSRGPWERIPGAGREAGRGLRGLVDVLRGGGGTPVRRCPHCRKRMAYESDTCRAATTLASASSTCSSQSSRQIKFSGCDQPVIDEFESCPGFRNEGEQARV